MGISFGGLGAAAGPRVEPRRVFVVSHTHWDREWYLPFEEFRARLVATVDDLLDLLARDPDFRHFTLDGQTVLLDDYLEARPERRDELRRHVAAGRLLVGPWFVMPDECLVSGESLVRNLLRGLRAAADFGQPMRVGYLPDTFGHVAQMPQVLRGFGIDSAVLWRGVGAGRPAEFVWRAPDGSEVLAHYLSEGYAAAADLPTDPEGLAEGLDGLRRALEPAATTGCLLLMNGGDHAPAQAGLPAALARLDGRLRDAELLHSTLPDFLAAVRASAARRGVGWEVVAGELRSPARAHLLAGVLSTRIWIKQRNAAVETLLERWAEPFAAFAGLAERARPLLRLAWRHLLLNQPHDSICGCSVDQVHEEMRVRFDRAEQLAGRVAEQALLAIAAQIDTTALAPAGAGTSRGQPSLVAVFNPGERARSDYVEATVVAPAGAAALAVCGPDGAASPAQVLERLPGDDLSVAASRAQVEGYLRLAGGGERWRLAILEKAVGALAGGAVPRVGVVGYELRSGRRPGHLEVEVRAADGAPHDFGVVGRLVRELRARLADEGLERVESVRFRLVRGERVRLGFVAQDVPACGYRVFRVVEGELPSPPPPLPQGEWSQSPSCSLLPAGEGLVLRAAPEIPTDLLAVRVDPTDGTLTLLDRESGALFAGLNAFVDSGEAGDEYTHCPPPRDLTVERPAAPPTVTLVEAGPARWTLRIDQTYLLPAGLDDDREERSPDRIPCAISTRVSLSPGVRRLDLEATVENAARDHLLRVRFPTGLAVRECHAASHFGVERRPVGPLPDGRGWPEQPVATFPHDGWLDVSDGRRGLLLAARGLPEAAVRPEASGATIYLTLLRAVGWLSRDDLATRQGAAGPGVPTPAAQCLGRQTYHYSLVPHAGGWAAAVADARAFAAPLRAVPVEPHAGPLPAELSFLAVAPAALVASAVKPSEEGEGLVVRLYNPSAADVEARVELWRPLVRAEATGLDEQPQRELAVDGRTVRLPVRAGQIATLRLHPAP